MDRVDLSNKGMGRIDTEKDWTGQDISHYLYYRVEKIYHRPIIFKQKLSLYKIK